MYGKNVNTLHNCQGVVEVQEEKAGFGEKAHTSPTPTVTQRLRAGGSYLARFR